MIFVFSGTGNSKAVADLLAKRLDDRVVSVMDAFSDADDINLAINEPLGFVFPVYSWGPPEIVLRLLSSVSLTVPPSYLYFVCTCGDDTGKTADVFCAAARARGWECKAGFSVTMPNTYVCLPGFDVDVADVQQRKLAHATIRVMSLAERIEARMQQFDCHEGAFPRLKTYGIRPVFNRFLMDSSKFNVTDNCVSCGKCIQVCPTKNITWKDGRPIWGNDCTMCLACYHHCPKHAVRYGKQTNKKGQYCCPL